MATTLTELNNLFGPDNIQKWADLDNDEDAALITARIAWAISLASEWVKARIEGTSYRYSEVSSHALVVYMETIKAGLLLYANRSVSEEDPGKNPMRAHEKDLLTTLKQISMREISLGSISDGRGFPAVVTDDDGDISTDTWLPGN